MAENFIVKEILGSNIKYINIVTLIMLTIIFFVPALILIFLRRKSQCIRHRSPYLLLISLFSKTKILNIRLIFNSDQSFFYNLLRFKGK